MPDGLLNPDILLTIEPVVAFVRHFVEAEKPLAAIRHGPWSLAEAVAVKDKRVTSRYSLKTDLTNAGAEWVDEPVVVDVNLVTSHQPSDLEEFDRALAELIAG